MTSDFPDPSPALVEDILSRTGSARYEEWWAKVADSGFCAAPVRLESRGAHLPIEVFARCKNRRATVCPSCSQLYAGDTWRLVHAGIVGEDEQSLLTGHPMVFVTLTAPSFGPVHSTGPFVGEPLHPRRYDYVGHVLFTWHAPALWHRFAVGIRRLVVRHCRQQEGDVRAKVAYIKVVELQRRAIPHFHAVIRLDDAAHLDTEQLGPLVQQAGRLAALQVRARGRTVTLQFGEQLDVRAFDELSGRKVARYLAKYVTKSVGDFGLTARRVHEGVIDELTVSNHIRRILRTIADVAREPEYRELGLWMHTLGYRGHITTKTRNFSTTMGELRARRDAWHREHGSEGEDKAVSSDPSDAEWQYNGCGHTTEGERYLAVSAAARDREMRQAAREALSCEDAHD